MSRKNVNKKKYLALTSLNLIILIIFCFIYACLVIKNFSNPLVGLGDEEQWEYSGFYLLKNISFNPLPHLDLANNQVFYPYGTSSVFQPWGIERDIFYAIFYSCFGIGPWVQVYYLLSVTITVVGSFILLLSEFGNIRATGFALIVSFFNFYAAYKYPGHLSYSIIHWTVLSFIVDFLIVKKIVERQYISFQLLILRIALLVLSIGQELGYIAGFALTSFTVSSIFIVIFILIQFKLDKNYMNLVKNYLIQWKAESFLVRKSQKKLACFLLLLLAFCIAIYFYIPLVYQIAREAKSFDFTGINSGSWWANPLRLVIPFFPFMSRDKNDLKNFFGDFPETFYDGSPGLFLLTIGILGIWQVRKRIVVFVPLITIFFLCLIYHPANLPTLKIFPWFAFNRLGGRSTVIYPIILGIFALHLNLDWLRQRTKKIVAGLLVILACTEIYTVYSLKLEEQPRVLEPNFFNYMNYVKKQPGEAVLDWPFCITGGNGVGADRGLCPYYWKNGSIFALRRFHEKKVMGQYFGRLHPSQLNSYLEAGWHNLLSPNSPDIFNATQLARCFRPNEWSFFTDFYKYNDFAGINIYTDLLPESCVQEFYKRFGQPVVKTTIIGDGKVEFIPKSFELRSQVNLELGSLIKFKPLLDFAEANLLTSHSTSSFVSINGFSLIEGTATDKWRWALGADSNIIFRLPESQLLKLSFAFNSPIEDQNLIVELNGETKAAFQDLKKDAIVNHDIKLQALKGINHIVFKYKYWNGNQKTFAPGDNRAMSVRFNKLVIEPVNNYNFLN
ncbi:hypothetical protein RIVM261_082430 [Rivularia sp. IAM M-261]|nr:hypothetical protein RIVM261_082430 [Rivularia sp. IAM M-261]